MDSLNHVISVNGTDALEPPFQWLDGMDGQGSFSIAQHNDVLDFTSSTLVYRQVQSPGR